LFRLTEWCKTWQSKFNPDKCEIMRITHKQNKSEGRYRLSPNGDAIKNVKNIKDLGITISYDLSWSDHIHDVVNKANRVLGLIKRILGPKSAPEFSLLYKSLVRPILEYAAPVWSPYLVKDIVLLEKVQRRASRLALGQKRGEMQYEERCTILKWSPLDKRRLYFSLLECYKFVFSLNNLVFQDFFELASKRTRSNHNFKLQFKGSNCNCYKYSFFVRIVKEWNDLPECVVEAGNFGSFKRSLRSFLNIM